MGFTDSIKWIAILVMVALFGFSVYYVINLKADLAVSEQNNKVLEQSVQSQKEVLEAKMAEIAEIQNINVSLSENNHKLQKDVETLNNKFNVSANGQARDFGAITRAKPAVINKIIDKATVNANRCLELATGAKLQEGETNAECKELVGNLSK